MLSVAQKHVPKKKPRRAPWMTKETLELIENRQKMKAGGRSIEVWNIKQQQQKYNGLVEGTRNNIC